MATTPYPSLQVGEKGVIDIRSSDVDAFLRQLQVWAQPSQDGEEDDAVRALSKGVADIMRHLKELARRRVMNPPPLRLVDAAVDPATGDRPLFDINELHRCDGCGKYEMQFIADGWEPARRLAPCCECGTMEYCSERCRELHLSCGHDEECAEALSRRENARESARQDASRFDAEAFACRAESGGWERDEVRDSVLNVAFAWTKRGRDAVLLIVASERPGGRFLPLQFIGARNCGGRDQGPCIEIRYVETVETEQKARSFLRNDIVEDVELSGDTFETIKHELSRRSWALTSDKGEKVRDYGARKVIHHSILGSVQSKAHIQTIRQNDSSPVSEMATDSGDNSTKEDAFLSHLEESISSASPRVEAMKSAVHSLSAEEKANLIQGAALLAKIIWQRECILERRRVEEVCRSCPPAMLGKNEDCPVCLEKVSKSSQGMMLVCCGKSACAKCMGEIAEKTGKFECPLCRENWDLDKMDEMQLSLANEGRAYAQYHVGRMHELGGGGFPMDAERAVRWFQLAAEQGHSMAQFHLAFHTFQGTGGLTKSLPGARRLFELSANGGEPQAQFWLGAFYIGGHEVAGRKDPKKALQLISLSASQGQEQGLDCLGDLFAKGDIVEKSLDRALHYYSVASYSRHVSSLLSLAKTVVAFAEERFGDAELPGSSPLPIALGWARKAAEEGCEEANRFIREYETKLSKYCSCCKKEGDVRACVRCRASWYCGKECQRKHWRDGHKSDCFELKTGKNKSWYVDLLQGKQ